MAAASLVRLRAHGSPCRTAPRSRGVGKLAPRACRWCPGPRTGSRRTSAGRWRARRGLHPTARRSPRRLRTGGRKARSWWRSSATRTGTSCTRCRMQAALVVRAPSPPRQGFDLALFAGVPAGIEPDPSSYPHELLGLWAWNGDVGAFWGASPSVPRAGFGAGYPAGLATYKGDAVGLHAAGGATTKFLADVALVADFDDGTTSGTVDGFRSFAGEALGQLSVTLAETGFSAGRRAALRRDLGRGCGQRALGRALVRRRGRVSGRDLRLRRGRRRLCGPGRVQRAIRSVGHGRRPGRSGLDRSVTGVNRPQGSLGGFQGWRGRDQTLSAGFRHYARCDQQPLPSAEARSAPSRFARRTFINEFVSMTGTEHAPGMKDRHEVRNP